jgi:hypothetical protein
MTLSTTKNREQYNGDGVNQDFPYTFLVLDASHLQVYVDNVLVTNYTVTGLKNPAGGLVQFDSAPPTGTGNVVILRQVPVTQETDYEEYDPFPAETHESALDYLTMICQQLEEELGRAVKYSALAIPGDPFVVNFGDAADRAGKIWAFDSSGQIVILIDTAEDRAYRWAETDEDVPVEFRDGRNRFSAYHWAQKAQTIVGLPFQTVGDLLTGTAPGGLGNVSILPIGANGMVLTADDTQPQGMLWKLLQEVLPGLNPDGSDRLKVLHVQPDGQAYELTGAYTRTVFHGKDFLEDDESDGVTTAEAGVPHYGNVAMKFTKPGVTSVVGWINGIILPRHDAVDFGLRLRIARSVGDPETLANAKFRATSYRYNQGLGLGGSSPPATTTVTAVAAAVPHEDGPAANVNFPTLFPQGGDIDILASVKIERMNDVEDTFAGEVDVIAGIIEDE